MNVITKCVYISTKYRLTEIQTNNLHSSLSICSAHASTSAGLSWCNVSTINVMIFVLSEKIVIRGHTQYC